MGRFARSQSVAASARPNVPVAAIPRFSKDPRASASKPKLRSHSFNQPHKLYKPDSLSRPGQSDSRFFKLDRRGRKRMRIIGLALLLIIGLGAGWILGKAVMGPSQIDQPESVISAEGTTEDRSANSIAETAPVLGTEAKPGDAREPRYESQVPNARDERYSRARNSVYPRRAAAASKARGGPGIGIVTRPLKGALRPLKRVNPFKLRLW
jgi:hypothetical protein